MEIPTDVSEDGQVPQATPLWLSRPPGGPKTAWTMTTVKGLAGTPVFYHSIRPIVFVGGFFGVIPIESALKTSPDQLKFSWCSVKVVYTLAVLGLLAVVAIFALMDTFQLLMLKDANIKDATSSMAGLVFRLSAVFSVAFFLHVAKRLPDLMVAWDETTVRTLKYHDINGTSQAAAASPHYPQKKMVIIACCLMSSAFLDRALHDARFSMVDILCANNLTDTVPSYAECYLENNAQYLVRLVGYPKWTAALVLTFNVFNTFTWNFLDLFIILLSCGLHHNFKHLNRFLELTKKVRRRPEEWKILREDHLALAHLVSRVDRVLSAGILYCYTANLISICTQMFLGLRPRNSSWLETTYTTVSFLHLVGRTAGVTWTASRIHDAYQVPLEYIHSCSSASYCMETQRLRAHILETPACLSGCRFFFITRSFFLGNPNKMPATLKSIENKDYEGTFSNVLSIDMWIWVSVLASGVFTIVLLIWSLKMINKLCRKKYRLSSVITPHNASQREGVSCASLPYNQTAF